MIFVWHTPIYLLINSLWRQSELEGVVLVFHTVSLACSSVGIPTVYTTYALLKKVDVL